MAVTAAQLIIKEEGCRNGGPVEASTYIYKGTMTFINADGYFEETINAGANVFGGIARADADNSSGADGDIDVDTDIEGIFTLTGSGFTQADVNSLIYASDNFTITTTSTSNSLVGRCVGYVSATQLRVKLLTADQ